MFAYVAGILAFSFDGFGEVYQKRLIDSDDGAYWWSCDNSTLWTFKRCHKHSIRLWPLLYMLWLYFALCIQGV